jgi:hypothetical protein
MNNANLGMWLGPVLAITSFILIGTTRNARNFGETCVGWAYDHLPAKVRSKLPGMQKVSERCKERSSARNIAKHGIDRTDISMVEAYALQPFWSNSSNRTRGKTAKNWFDSEEDLDDVRSLHSGDSTLAGQDDYAGKGTQVQNDHEGIYSPGQTTTEISAGPGNANWTQGISVTRQVIVATSFR